MMIKLKMLSQMKGYYIFYYNIININFFYYFFNIGTLKVMKIIKQQWLQRNSMGKQHNWILLILK